MALNGDPVAAIMLWRILDSCEYGYSDRQRFEAAIKTLKVMICWCPDGRSLF
jgi:hypothetical protein